MIDAELTAFLESPCAQIVALLDSGGHPFATRAWGIEVLDPHAATVRVLVGEGELARVAGKGEVPVRLAVTAVDVPSLRSVQLKGTVAGIDPASAQDLARSAAHCRGFAEVVERTNGTPGDLVARMVPDGLLACVVVVSDLFDQTPGPRAGAPVVPR